MTSIQSLFLANLLFVGSHLAMSHLLRRPMVSALGERGFLGAYSLVSIALFVWIVRDFGKAAPGPLLWDAGDAGWLVASVLTVVALALLLGSLRGNPALPQVGADVVASADAGGVYAVTRHPMMWAFALWAVAHIIAWPGPRTLVMAGAMGLLALVGANLQDGKKRIQLGEAWATWEAKTSYWPRPAGLVKIGLGLWLAALVLWLALTWLHVWMAGIPAGMWKWWG